MKITFITFAVATSVNSILLAEPPPFRVTKERIQQNQISGEAKKPDAEFRIRYSKEDASVPDLAIPTYSSGSRRVVDVRLSQGRIEVAIQVDELGIDYYDYRLNNGRWDLNGQRRVCSLNGVLALSLARVDILENGVVEVAYREESSGGRNSSWADELLAKENHGKAGLMKEEYKLKDGQFVLSGDAVRLRPTAAPDSALAPENIAPEDVNGRLVEGDLSNAQIVKRDLMVAEKLNLEEIKKINNSINANPILVSDPDIQVKTPREAFDRININLSMAKPPEVFAEDETHYYFSGGLSVEQIDDFSSGIRLTKIGGGISVWQLHI